MLSFKELTGLRGICSLLIVCGHFYTNFTNDFGSVSLDYFAPVTLFFIVSGFLLGVLYKNKLDEWQQRKVFWIKRFARLAPMYYFSLLFCLPSFIAYTYSSNNLVMFILSILFTPTFLQSLTLVGNDWSGPLWQISAFALCYLIYPFMLKPLKSRPFVFATIFYVVPIVALGLAFGLGWPLGIIHTWAVLRAPHFFIGVILGLLFPQDNTEAQPLQESPSAAVKKIVCVEIVTWTLTSLFVVCYVLGQVIGIKMWWSFMLWEEFLVVPLHCLWIYFLCRAPEGGITSRFLCSWAVEKLGEISYSVYVMHWPLLYLYSWLKMDGIPKMKLKDRYVMMGNDTSLDGLFILDNYDLLSVLSILICISILIHHYIENPARDWITKKFVEEKK